MKTIETNSEARARVIHARQSRMNEVIHDFVETGTVNVTSLAQVPLADCPPRYQWLVNTILAGTDTSPVSDEPARLMRAVLRAYISTGKVLPLAYSPAFGNHPRLADLQDFLLQQHTLGGNDSMKLYECTPAMGRDYRSAAAVRADWNANKDFIAHTAFQSTYINKQDADRHGVTVQIYYANRRKAIVIAPTKD